VSVASAAHAGRRAAEALMLDTFTAYTPSDSTQDADGMETPGYTPAGTTRGKIQGGSRQSSDVTVAEVTIGGISRPIVRGGLHVPVSSPQPKHGDLGAGWEYVLTSLGPSTPPELLGSRWLVVGSEPKSYMTARRLDVVRLS
jgi:hypothetical protein